MYFIYTLFDGSKAYYTPKSTYENGYGEIKNMTEQLLWEDFNWRKQFVIADKGIRINKKYIVLVELVNESL